MIVYEEMIEIGLKYTSELIVTDAVTAIVVGSADGPVRWRQCYYRYSGCLGRHDAFKHFNSRITT